jgi:hypothetical protein
MQTYDAMGITPAIASSKPDTGSAYAYSARDSLSRYLEGSGQELEFAPSPPKEEALEGEWNGPPMTRAG